MEENIEKDLQKQLRKEAIRRNWNLFKQSKLGMIGLYIVIFFISSLLIMMSGHDLVTSFSSTAACLNNLGPALGDAYGNYEALNDFSKSILSLVMIIGRLEIYTFIILVTKYFWKY